jgi:endonuclease/exonuclease/phosphatase family metal-dependent hydrolase
MDQLKRLADHMAMQGHFAPAMKFERGAYGNAVLSRYPARVVRAAQLPRAGRREMRGALWVCFDFHGVTVNLVTTHLGLGWFEARRQSRALCGEQFLANPHMLPPMILCGDLNLASLRQFERSSATPLTDVRRRRPSKGKLKTFPSSFPILALDHILVSDDIDVGLVDVPKTALTKLASDHFPILAELGISTKSLEAQGL